MSVRFYMTHAEMHGQKTAMRFCLAQGSQSYFFLFNVYIRRYEIVIHTRRERLEIGYVG